MKDTDELKTHSAAMGKAVMSEMTGSTGETVTKSTVDPSLVEEFISGWGNIAQKAAHSMMKKYGPPNEAMPSRLIWYNNGPWKRTIVYRDEIPHNFPAPHVDVLEQVINYKLPVEKVSELAAFDGSVIVERTRGEVSARCDLEAANFLSLNLVNDIVTGALTVEQARQKYGESMSAYLMNRPAPYSEGFQFQPPSGDTQDIDETKIAAAMAEQFSEKVKDAFR